ncbi:MAG: translation initiation factor IF-2, partial [Nitrospinae bacterium]|nr:translation initiation factor IF-2 [Nitrospinota bacterium]
PVKAKAKTVIKAEPKTTAKTAIKKKFSSEKSELTPLLDLKPITKIISKTEKPTEIKAVAEAEPAKAPKKHGLKIVKKEDKPKAAAKKPKAAPKPAREKTKKPKPVREKSQPPVAAKEPPPTEPQEVEEETFETVEIPPNIHVRDLADKLKCAANDIIMNLMGLGIMTTINQSLDFDVASKVADQRGFEVILVTPESEIGFEEEEEDLEKDRVHRAPIVTIMGHVDHGKTSLLDAIRETNLAKQEAGGITQHIGAYQAKIKGSLITFLDTPGHEAFTAMRARGVQVTDIVVLVVAADDGIKPQTKEAIDHANAAGVPILVAINKIDKADAKPDEVKKQLADQGLLPEDWGGQTIFTEVSALQKTGIDHLLEMILLQAEIMDLKVNPKVKARAAVIESKLDKGRGPVATLIIQKGTLKIGDPFIVGCYFGKVRALISDNGSKILQAPPATPVEVVGLPDVPQPGDEFMVVQDEKKARQLSNLKLQRQRESILAQSSRITMDDLHQQIVEGKIKELNLIIKADVQGSIHAVQEAFSKLESDEVRIKVIHDGVGGITESDVLLSTASNAIIIGFNVRPTDKAAQLAARDNVDIRLYNIIYDAIDDMKKALEGLLEPKFTERTIGKAEVREVFTIPKVGTIAGCHVVSGKIERLLDARLIRDSVVVYQGKIASIRRFKEDVKEVLSGYECGISLDKYQDVKQGDIIEPFILEEVT